MPIGAIVGGLFGLAGAASNANATRDAANIQAQSANRAIDLQQSEYQDISGKLAPFRDLGTSGLNQLAMMFGIGPGQDPGSAPYGQSVGQTVGAPPSPGQFPTLGGSSIGPPGAALQTGAPDPSDPSLRAKFTASPGYQYQIDQMTQALQNSASGKTGVISGNMMTELQKGAAGLAGQDWSNFYNQSVNTWGNNIGNQWKNYSANDQNYWNNYNALNQNYGQRYTDAAGQRNQMIAALSGFAQGGQSAATNTGNFGAAAATSAGNALQSAAAAQAAGRIGSANAWSGAFSNPNVTGMVGNGANWLYNQMFLPSSGDYGGGGYSGGGGNFSGGMEGGVPLA